MQLFLIRDSESYILGEAFTANIHFKKIVRLGILIKQFIPLN